jgi:hypothetical protein
LASSRPCARTLVGQKLHVVLDTYSPHKHAKVPTWAAGNDIELFFLPACGSWLCWIEAEFAARRHFSLNGTDHRSHDEQYAAIAAYVRWRIAQRPQCPARLCDAPAS